MAMVRTCCARLHAPLVGTGVGLGLWEPVLLLVALLGVLMMATSIVVGAWTDASATRRASRATRPAAGS